RTPRPRPHSGLHGRPRGPRSAPSGLPRSVSEPGGAALTDPARAALVMIECQRGVVGDLSVLPDLAAAAQPVLETIGRLARVARRHGVTVVHLTYAPLAEGRSVNLRSSLT